MGISQKLYREAKRIIPGGTQLLTKRPEMFLPDLWPAYYKKAKGCRVWDLDGNRYIDTSYMGVGSCILGYADKDVDRAVRGAIDKGTMSTLNCPEEVELAKELCSIHPWARMARFARTGGEAMAIAVRIARAKTKKDNILFCGYHGWSDWYLAANLKDKGALKGHLLPGLEPRGVPRALIKTAVPFEYNDKDRFLTLIKRLKKDIAAVIMEPIRNYYPVKGFLETIREVTEKEGILLIFDEITSGWRLCPGGAHLNFKVWPDVCVFAKAMSNGYPMASIIGTKDAMETAQDMFISSTYWTERVGPSAALATIKKLRQQNVPTHLIKIGRKVQEGWNKLSKRNRLKISVTGIYPLSHFAFNHKKALVLKTLFTQFMLERAFLASDVFYTSFAHSDDCANRYLECAEEAFHFISKAIKEGRPDRHLKGPVCHSGFRRLA